MALYRLYFIDKNGRFCRRLDFEAETDEAAVEKSGESRDGYAAELWCGARKVRGFEGAADDRS